MDYRTLKVVITEKQLYLEMSTLTTLYPCRWKSYPWLTKWQHIPQWLGDGIPYAEAGINGDNW